MKKKIFFILSIFIAVELLNIINLANGFNCNLVNLDANKNKYYFNEDIKINASWELYYNTLNEIAYTQIHILDTFDQIIWNSSKCNQVGNFEKNWTVNVKELNLDFINYSYIVYIKFFVFYFQIDTTNTMCIYLETLEIKIMKRNISCEVIGYKDRLILGENLSIIAKFSDNTTENIQNLINQTIQFIITFDDLILFQRDYKTNASGAICINLSSLTHLKLGLNFLIFSIKNSILYNDTKFVYKIFTEKNDLIIDIITFNNNLNDNEDLEIKLYCYYYINQSIKPLVNYILLIKIFKNLTLTFINEYKTDKYGILTVFISQDSFNYNQKSQDFNLNIIFNGTDFLDNKTIVLSFKLNHDIYSKIQNTFQIRIISFTAILFISLILISYVIINKKSKSEKLLTELIIRY